MSGTPISSSRCTAVEPRTRGRVARIAGCTWIAALACVLGACRDRSYPAMAEQHLGAVTRAAVTTVTQLESGHGAEEALRQYDDAIRACEAFLAAQQREAGRESYRKLAALLERHKAFRAAAEEWDTAGSGSRPQPAATEGGEEEATAVGPRPWVPEMNALLRESGEVRGLLRRGN